MTRARRRTLASRIVLATVSVALLAAVATAVVAFQLVRHAGVQQSRDVLHQAVSLIADAPVADRAALVRAVDGQTNRGIHVVVVRPGGVTVPLGGGGVTAEAQRVGRRSANVTAQIRSGGQTLLVAGRTLPSGVTVIATQDLSLAQSTTARLVWRFALAAALGVIVAVGVGILVARVVSRPLARAAASAKRLASGERGVVPPGTTTLGTATVAEVDDVEQALAALDSALARSEGRQHEFLLSISHEIRTPLTAIRGYADAIADGLVTAVDLPSIGQTLVAETARLEAFTRDLLELARLEADDFSIRPEPVDLTLIARDAGAAWSARARSLDVSLVVEDGRPIVVVTDPMRVRQLLDGLVENALRASPPRTTVRVRLRGGDDATLVVSDEGPGLSPVDTADAFERGILADRYRASRPVGTGLGLSIAARLVSRLGGSLVVGSSASGGAEFTVTLPA